MSDNITISWRGSTRTFSPGNEATIGRDLTCDFVVDNPNVSRLHVLIFHEASGWLLRDMGSSQGTFLDGEAVTEVRLGASQRITLGAPRVGATIELVVAEGAPSTRPPGSPTDADPTVIPGQKSRLGGALRDDLFKQPTVVIGEEALRLECAGRTYQFGPERAITVGRNPEADVVSTKPTVSRDHGRISHDGQGWTYQGVGISKTYIEGRRVTSVRLRGATTLWLGDPTTGERLDILASNGTAVRPTDPLVRWGRSGNLRIATVVTALVAVGLIVFALGRESGAIDREALARGVVRIETENVYGSGTVIDAERGIILTSAHIVEPRALGQGVLWGLKSVALGENPREIVIWVAPGLDEVAEPRFLADVVVADGYLDLAVIQITRTVGGALVSIEDLAGLTEIPLGDSASMNSGDPIDVLGYPGIAGSNAATLTTGVLAGSVQDLRIGTNRALVNLDAEIRRGNSGGLVADSRGAIIGVPTLRREMGAEDIGAMRPVELAGDLIKAALDGGEYLSDFVTPLTGREVIDEVHLGSGVEQGFTLGCNQSVSALEVQSTAISLTIDYEGFDRVEHQDVLIGIWDVAHEDYIGQIATGDYWPVPFDDSGCLTVGIPLYNAIVPGRYTIDFYLGPNYDRGDSFSFELD